MVETNWSMDTYIASCSLIDYYYSVFYSLGHGATIVTSYYTIVTSDAMILPSKGFCQTIVQYDTMLTVWCDTISTMTTVNIGRYFESVCTITEGHATRNKPIGFEYLHLTYNKSIYVWRSDY